MNTSTNSIAESKNTSSTTDVSNGKRFVARNCRKARYIYKWREWVVWDGKRWKRDNIGAAQRLAKETGGEIFSEAARENDTGKQKELAKHAGYSLSAVGINRMLSMAQSEPEIEAEPDIFDRDKWLLNFINGTLDLKSGVVREHRVEDYITRLCPTSCSPEPEAPNKFGDKCPKWLEFLDRIFRSKPELIAYVQRLMGYMLTGEAVEQVLPIFVGGGANGKSTLLNTIISILGGDYAMAAPDDFIATIKKDRHPTGIADLYRMRFVVASETQKGGQLDEALVKRLTGDDPLRARGMHKDYFEFNPTHKIVLMTNHRPTVQGTDHAIWRRIQLVPFDETISEDERDSRLGDKLKLEASGILEWCLAGCQQWQQSGLMLPSGARQATAEYRADQDTLGKWITDCCTMDAAANGKASSLFRSYKAYCNDLGIQHQTQPEFSTSLEKRGHSRCRKRDGFHYTGVEITPQIAT